MANPSRRELTDLLAGVGLFSRCSTRERSTVARHMETATLPAEATLIEEGEEGDALFVIIEGSASVRRGDHEVATVRTGAVFGEMALLDGEPRSATVVATTPVTVAVLGVRMFRTLLREFPEMTFQLLAGLAADLRHARDLVDAANKVVVPRA
jgi:CRP-like cAMP-binding protein